MLPKLLAVCLPLVFDVVRSDKDREVVCCALECINEMLKQMKGGLVSLVIYRFVFDGNNCREYDATILNFTKIEVHYN